MDSNFAPLRPPPGGFGAPADGFGPPTPEPPPLSRAAIASVALGMLMVPGCVCGLGALPLWGLGIAFGVAALRQRGPKRGLWVAWLGILLNVLPLLLVACFVSVGHLPFAVRL